LSQTPVLITATTKATKSGGKALWRHQNIQQTYDTLSVAMINNVQAEWVILCFKWIITQIIN